MTGVDDDRDYDIEFIKKKEEDQDFIATARNVFPSLINEIRKLKEKLIFLVFHSYTLASVEYAACDRVIK